MKPLKLMPHQEEALDMTADRNRVAYFYDMGLGKTFIGSEKMWQLNNYANLVVCQKSKVDDWIQHFTEYYPDDMKVFNLTKKSEALSFKNHIDAGIQKDGMVVGVINYDLLFRRSYYAHMTGFTLMLDESSLISNERAKRSRYVLRMKPESVILLSGTPTAGKYEKLWSQCNLLGWKISKRAFYGSYIITEWVDYGTGFLQEVVTGYKNTDHLKRKLAEYGALFKKTEEVLTLPDQVEQIIQIAPTKEYQKFIKSGYVQINKARFGEFELDSDFFGSNKDDCIELIGDNSLTKMLYARQLCGQYHKEKLQVLRDLIQSTEERFIIFYNFNEELRQMKNHLMELKRPFSVLNGSTKDLTAYEQDDSSITFIQYQAGAMGGNFQKARRTVYFTLPLGKGSCDLWEQSKKRTHRIGQNHTCFYYYPLVKNSIEVKNLKALKEGKELTDDLFKT